MSEAVRMVLMFGGRRFVLVVLAVAGLWALPLAACVKTVRWELQPPYGMRLPDGSRGGYYADVTREALRRLGCETRFVEMPWARGMNELREGRIDLMPGMLRTPEREQYAYFSRGINLSPNMLFLHRSVPESRRPKLLVELRELPLTIGVEAGAIYSAEYAELLKDPVFASRLHFLPDRFKAWQMLSAGRLDGVISDEASGLIEGFSVQSKEALARPTLELSARPARVAFSKRQVDPGFIERFDAVIDEMVDDGTIQRLREQYIPCLTDPDTLRCAPLQESPPPEGG